MKRLIFALIVTTSVFAAVAIAQNPAGGGGIGPGAGAPGGPVADRVQVGRQLLSCPLRSALPKYGPRQGTPWTLLQTVRGTAHAFTRRWAQRKPSRS